MPSRVENIRRVTRYVREGLTWSKKTSWRGFEEISLYDAINFLIKEIRRGDVVAKSQAIAYSFFLSIFPAILVLFTLLPLFHLDGRIIDPLEENIYRALPGQSAAVAMELIRDILTRPRGALLSLSFVLAIYFSSNGMMRLMMSFDKSDYSHTFRSRKNLRSRLIALGLTLGVTVLLVAALLLITVGHTVINWLTDRYDLPISSRILLGVVQYFAFFAFVYTGIAGVYRYGAATHKRFHYFTPGSFLATFLVFATSFAFATYVDRLGQFNQLYGSIGTVIVFMLWLQFNILWILIGYELNASIAVVRDTQQRGQP